MFGGHWRLFGCVDIFNLGFFRSISVFRLALVGILCWLVRHLRFLFLCCGEKTDNYLFVKRKIGSNFCVMCFTALDPWCPF